MIKNCEMCSREFEARRSTARFCGSGCRLLAWQRRRAGGVEVAEPLSVVGEVLPAVVAAPVPAGGRSLGETMTGPGADALTALIGWLGDALDSLPVDARGVFGPRGAKVLAELIAAREVLRPAAPEPARPAIEGQLEEFRRRALARKLAYPSGLPYEVVSKLSGPALHELRAALNARGADPSGHEGAAP